MNAISKALSSTKFMVLLAFIVGATVLTALGKLTPEQWTDFAKWLGGGWMLAQGIADHGKNTSAAPRPPAPPVT